MRLVVVALILLAPVLIDALSNDACGPTVNQDPNVRDSCNYAVRPNPQGNIPSQQIPSAYGFVCDLDGSQKPLDPSDCQSVIADLCNRLADTNIQRDIWHWSEKRGCRVGMWLPGQAGSAPLPSIEKCIAQVFEPMVQQCAAWGIPSRHGVTPPVNRGSVNINATLEGNAGGSGYPAIDEPYSEFSKTQTGIPVNVGYPSYIIEAPANY